MSTPEEGSPGPRTSHPKYVFRYTCHVEGEKFAQGIARRRARSFEADGEPKLVADYDRSRHVFKITQEGGETAEFDDRTARFLFMEHDSETGKTKPATEWGGPVYYHLAREVEGESPEMEMGNEPRARWPGWRN